MTDASKQTSEAEAILLKGIEDIAKRESHGGRSFSIMDAIGANEYANAVLVAYWKAKASQHAD